MGAFFAHTLPNRPESDWEPLEDHLNAVAVGNAFFAGAAGFAEPFGGREVARIAGLWHDLGKYAPQFQAYLRGAVAGTRGSVDHSTAGAALALRAFGATEAAGILAFVIAGHHAGLADLGSAQSNDGSCLARRLLAQKPETVASVSAAPDTIKRQSAPTVPPWFAPNGADAPLRRSMLIRMIFSCLIDADRLATEAFYSSQQATVRGGPSPDISQLRNALDAHLARFAAGQAASAAQVNKVRGELLGVCRERAAWAPGLFSLTAPTGSGKTLSSIAFALRHAEIHGLRRVIYALPFTSVTEQNAGVFRAVFESLGPHAVLEHHSAYRPCEQDEDHPTEIWRRLAVENWDAPIVVTTNVQLFESLFSANPSDCRKLHRIARSVIILDEAQTLPVHLLKPTLAALQELAASYGVSAVLCTATMPAVGHRPEFPIGLKNLREIVSEPERMARSMRRARVTPIGHMEDEPLADRIASERQVLAIVNTRMHAARLFELVRARTPDVLHLSALMCPEHRSARVREINERLKRGHPCRVVSTQVVEAGVDIDFPVVLRAFAGLDSIIQAAGRCNRDGRGPEGRVEVFETDERPPPGIRPAIDATRQVLGSGVDALGLDTIEEFFRLYYWQRSQEWDGGIGEDGRSLGLTDLLTPRKLAFRTAASRYRLIDRWSEPIVVPYGDQGKKLCDHLAAAEETDRRLLRDSQRFTVNVPPYVLSRLVEAGHAAVSLAGPTVLVFSSLYEIDLGLRLESTPDPADLMA